MGWVHLMKAAEVLENGEKNLPLLPTTSNYYLSQGGLPGKNLPLLLTTSNNYLSQGGLPRNFVFPEAFFLLVSGWSFLGLFTRTVLGLSRGSDLRKGFSRCGQTDKFNGSSMNSSSCIGAAAQLDDVGRWKTHFFILQFLNFSFFVSVCVMVRLSRSQNNAIKFGRALRDDQ